MAAARSILSRLPSYLRNSNYCYLNKLQNAPQRGYADGHQMALTFASPAKILYNNANVKQVDVPSFSGSFGILPNHVPSLAVLRPGVLTVFEQDGNPKKYFVSSGTVTINDDSSVQILAEEAVTVEDLDPKVTPDQLITSNLCDSNRINYLCREGLARAQQELTSSSDERAKAEAQISVEVYEALVKAVE